MGRLYPRTLFIPSSSVLSFGSVERFRGYLRPDPPYSSPLGLKYGP